MREESVKAVSVEIADKGKRVRFKVGTELPEKVNFVEVDCTSEGCSVRLRIEVESQEV